MTVSELVKLLQQAENQELTVRVPTPRPTFMEDCEVKGIHVDNESWECWIEWPVERCGSGDDDDNGCCTFTA